MNHKEIATKIADRFFDEDRMPVTRNHLIDSIAAATNEAAWRGWKAGVTAQDHAWHGRVEQCHYCEEMHAETYGPRPKENRDE